MHFTQMTVCYIKCGIYVYVFHFINRMWGPGSYLTSGPRGIYTYSSGYESLLKVTNLFFSPFLQLYIVYCMLHWSGSAPVHICIKIYTY